MTKDDLKKLTDTGQVLRWCIAGHEAEGAGLKDALLYARSHRDSCVLALVVEQGYDHEHDLEFYREEHEDEDEDTLWRWSYQNLGEQVWSLIEDVKHAGDDDGKVLAAVEGWISIQDIEVDAVKCNAMYCGDWIEDARPCPACDQVFCSDCSPDEDCECPGCGHEITGLDALCAATGSDSLIVGGGS